VKFFVTIFALLILMPPAQAHIDVIAFDAVELHVDEDYFNEAHQQEHHNHDSEDEKQSEHHHHCTMLGFSFAIINTNVNYTLFLGFEQKIEIISYDNLHENSCLDQLFQPPQIA